MSRWASIRSLAGRFHCQLLRFFTLLALCHKNVTRKKIEFCDPSVRHTREPAEPKRCGQPCVHSEGAYRWLIGKPTQNHEDRGFDVKRPLVQTSDMVFSALPGSLCWLGCDLQEGLWRTDKITLRTTTQFLLPE